MQNSVCDRLAPVVEAAIDYNGSEEFSFGGKGEKNLLPTVSLCLFEVLIAMHCVILRVVICARGLRRAARVPFFSSA